MHFVLQIFGHFPLTWPALNMYPGYVLAWEYPVKLDAGTFYKCALSKPGLPFLAFLWICMMSENIQTYSKI